MPVDFSNELYLVAFDTFARPMTLTPVVSQPGQGAYAARCYFDTRETDVLAEDGSIFSDSRVFIDIRMEEFPILPMQRDLVDIPAYPGWQGGMFEVSDLGGDGNAGGIITLTLKKILPSLP